MAEDSRLLRCFSPILGVAIGLAVGWGLHFYLPEKNTFTEETLARLVELIFGIAGWGAGVVIGQGKKMHCGGSERMDKAAKSRYGFLFLGCLGLFVFAPIFLVKDQPVLCMFSLFILLCLLCGEIGWGKPLKILERLDA